MKTNKNTVFSIIVMLVICVACKKTHSSGGAGNGTRPPTTDSVYAPVDPSNPSTIGFFSNGWQQKTFTDPVSSAAGSTATGTVTDSLIIDVNKVLVRIPPTLYGINSNPYMTQIVTQPSLMGYIKDLAPRIIRGPGGSLSDVYFWNDTAAAPADAPDSLPDGTGKLQPAGYWFGGNTASWTIALSNYYNMLAQTGSTGIITVNYGYARYGTSANPVAAAAHLAADWVRYDKGRTKFWEIGNETYGNWEAGYRIDQTRNKDGQPMIVTGALYGQHVKVFADSMRAAATQTGATIYIGATLYQQAPQSYDYASIQTWNQGVLSQAGNAPDFYIVHNYYTAYNTNSTVADILATSVSVTTNMMSYVTQQESGGGVTAKPIALTEWNIQARGSKQNTSYIAGIHAVKTLGSLIRNQYGEASRWDLANGYANGDDMGMFNIGDEAGAPLWNPRPAFYYLYYFQQMTGDRLVYDTLKASNGDITTYSSTFSSGQAGTAIINSGVLSHTVSIDFRHFPAGSHYYWYILTGGTDNAPFSSRVYVNGAGPSTSTGGPLNYASIKPYASTLNGTIKIAVPPLSVIYLVADNK
ncbi:MAG TPA: hypothetical protein VG605_10835 [Puia sp.]|nr:hypothetical protein [Puia sp.]